MIREIAALKANGTDVGRLAARFMNTLIEMAVQQCLDAREASGVNTVALSGGSFQNMVMMARLPARLEKEGFQVLRHRRVSCNDEGLSLGQLMIAQAAIEVL
jgi:hydrogenase maturation protein HypF